MAWRLARSLDVLRAEVRARHPGTRVDTIGDQSHASGASDHNPNPQGVVCAADFFGDRGLDLAWFAGWLVTKPHPALKYVIYNRRIASRAQGWVWRPYYGSNPHISHVHGSVGTGPDGRSTGPYDDTTPWGIAPREDDDMALTDDQAKQLKATNERVLALCQLDPTVKTVWAKDKDGVEQVPAVQVIRDTAERTTVLAGQIAEVASAVRELRDRPAPGTVEISDEQLERVLRRAIGSVDGASPAT